MLVWPATHQETQRRQPDVHVLAACLFTCLLLLLLLQDYGLGAGFFSLGAVLIIAAAAAGEPWATAAATWLT
jgi:hypothetical protein